MTKETAGSPTLAAVRNAHESLIDARVRVEEALKVRDEAIAAAVAAGDYVVDVAYAARMNSSNVGRRVAAAALKEAAK